MDPARHVVERQPAKRTRGDDGARFEQDVPSHAPRISLQTSKPAKLLQAAWAKRATPQTRTLAAIHLPMWKRWSAQL
jgi:hypothetical protein